MTWPPLSALLSRLRHYSEQQPPVRTAEPGLPATQLTEHFALAEMACRDGSVVPEHLVEHARELCVQLEVLRAHLRRPIVIVSGFRTPEHNVRVKGASSSQHLLARAADVIVAGVAPAAVAAMVEHLVASGEMVQGGLGQYSRWVHLDVRGKRARWRGP